MQTTYSLDLDRATAGQIVYRAPGGMRGRYEPSEALPPGRLVEYSGGNLRLPQATTLGSVVGGTPYIATRQTSIFGVGEGPVPALRRGLMWVEYGGTAPTPESAVNIMHSSTIATDRGKVTASAVSAVAGSEVSAFANARCVEVDTSLGLALIDLNLP